VAAAEDLVLLPVEVATAARVCDNGEVEWPLSAASDAIRALAGVGRRVLGLDLRKYEGNAAASEAPWWAGDNSTPEAAAEGALTALSRPSLMDFLDYEWVVITWS
jgi:hypothetical protein